jgi:hypothetical protein
MPAPQHPAVAFLRPVTLNKVDMKIVSIFATKSGQFYKLMLGALCSSWPNKNVSLVISTKCNEFLMHVYDQNFKKQGIQSIKHFFLIYMIIHKDSRTKRLRVCDHIMFNIVLVC